MLRTLVALLARFIPARLSSRIAGMVTALLVLAVLVGSCSAPVFNSERMVLTCPPCPDCAVTSDGESLHLKLPKSAKESFETERQAELDRFWLERWLLRFRDMVDESGALSADVKTSPQPQGEAPAP